MNQFHTDFNSDIITGNQYKNKVTKEVITQNMSMADRKEFLKDKNWKAISDIHAVESIFLGKKCYIDVLKGLNSMGEVVFDYHMRMKGIPNGSIKYKAKVENRTLMDIYKSLYQDILKHLTYVVKVIK